MAVAVWQCDSGSVAVWQCGSVAVWQCVWQWLSEAVDLEILAGREPSLDQKGAQLGALVALQLDHLENHSNFTKNHQKIIKNPLKTIKNPSKTIKNPSKTIEKSLKSIKNTSKNH
jgi:hypothetical protein